MRLLALLCSIPLLASCPGEPAPNPTPGYDCARPTEHKGVVKVANAIAGRYIVVLKNKPPQGVIQTYDVGVTEVKTFERGYAAKIARQALAKILADPNVAYVQEDGVKSVFPRRGVQSVVTWGKDRIDQRALPLDGTYEPGASGINVHAFVIDTGVDPLHPEFTGRMEDGFSSFGGEPTDGHGHGTHVAGTIAGFNYGVARDAHIHPVKVLADNGSGSDSGVIRGVNWVAQWKRNNPDELAVANMSLGGGASPALDQAVCDAIAAGVTFAIAAGNEGVDAEESSPGRVRQAITVGATDRQDVKADWSNYGLLLDLFAPGVDILSAKTGGGTDTMSGTSMAAPHVAGAAALVLQRNPDANPQEVRDRLVLWATPDKLSRIGDGSPNLLLFAKEE